MTTAAKVIDVWRQHAALTWEDDPRRALREIRCRIDDHAYGMHISTVAIREEGADLFEFHLVNVLRETLIEHRAKVAAGPGLAALDAALAAVDIA
jgi:hypothetical protein